MAKKQIEQTEIEASYELPEGWKWCRQNEVCKLTDGEKLTGVDYPYLEVKYLRGNKDKEIVSSGKFIKQGTKVILVDGENSGEVFTVPEDGFMGSTFKSLSIQNVDENYLQFFISTKKDLYRNNKKGSAIPHLNKELFFNMPFPLPPTLEEQQRIVNRIETLFAKLDQAKEKAQNVVDTFETRKASILHKAFTGELTKKWRAENGVGDDSWEEKTGETIFSYITSGSRGWASYYSDAGEMFIRMGNLNHGTIDLELSNIQYVNLPDSVEGTRSQLKEKDILISITADLGMIGLVRKLNTNAYINQHIALARPSSEVNAEFIAWELVSDIGFSQLQGNKKGSTKIGLGLSDIKNLRLLVPTLPEQTEIVLILDKVFEKENKAKEAAEAVLEQIDLLKKSILARAFRGEL